MEFDPAENDMDSEVLENARYIPVVVLGTLSSTLSLIGSGCIVYMSSQQLDQIKQRLLFGLSLADFVNSVSRLLMPFMVPASLGLPGALGDHASCSAVAFFFAASNKLAASYAAYLSIYFLLLVRRNWKEHDFTFPLEFAAHAIALIIPLALDSAAVATESMNPRISVNNLCLYSAYPPGCTDEDDCERSTWRTGETLVDIASIHFFFNIALCLFCTGLVWVTVRKTLRRISRYNFAVSSSVVQGELPLGSYSKRWSSRFLLARTSSWESQPDLQGKRIRQVGTRAQLYTAAYVHTCFWPLLLVIMTNIYSPEDVEENKLNPGWYALLKI
ncbi:expressed unknown protein [Seminavis robusta]|uniref:G protein-coupled receptor n=1 Tax=Seminavis robusta TaxID=568900 RepID=A0A9N8HP93_9STRA|nr:expressed unknown protein [Seminavis robusta]|eukprot:Sro1050_g235450.1 n/a (330) ;mRNA; r:1496-2485